MQLPKRRSVRPGYLNSVELILFLPLVIFSFAIIVQYNQVLAAEARLFAAAREGARVAASGGNSHQIGQAVFPAMRPSERDQIVIETNVVDSHGDPISVMPGSDVVVRVSIPIRDVVPSALLLIFMTERDLVGQTVMRKE